MRAKVREIEEWRLGEHPSSAEIADELGWDDVDSLGLISIRDLYELDEWNWWDDHQDQLCPEEQELDSESWGDYDSVAWG